MVLRTLVGAVGINLTLWCCASILVGVTFADAQSDQERLQFDGNSYVTFNITTSTRKRFTLSVSFRSHGQKGTLLRSSGNSLSIMLAGSRLQLLHAQGSQYFEVASLDTDASRAWHDVIVSSEGSHVHFVVDGVTRVIENQQNLDLGQTVYLGGHRLTSNASRSQQNFVGCLQNATLNGLALFAVSQSGERPAHFVGNVVQGCNIPVKHVTFSGDNSFLRIPSTTKGDSSTFSATFDLRTYDPNATLLFVDMGHGVNITIDLEENAHLLAIYLDGETRVQILYELDTGVVIRPADGRWHRFSFQLNNSTGLTMTLDKWAIVDEKIKSAARGDNRTFYLGGIPDSMGFKGCMRDIVVDGSETDLSQLQSPDAVMATLGVCDLPDRCFPDSCSHGGLCYQTRAGFSCDCSGTGYGGAVCHTPLYEQTCELVDVSAGTKFLSTMIDVDGSGPLDPLPVVCHKESPDHVAQTLVQAVLPPNNTVDGHDLPGSFVGEISYQGGSDEVAAVIDRARSCRQFIEYNCTNSKLLAKSGQREESLPYGWWVGRHNQSHFYWGGAKPDSRGCACAESAVGCVNGKSCNCDAGEDGTHSDGGYLLEKSHLPVTQVRFGDTGTRADKKRGQFRVGSVLCQGDEALASPVTFNKLGASIRLDLTFSKTPADIWFQFRTGIRRAYLLHTESSVDAEDGRITNALSVRLSGSFSLVVDFTLLKQRTVFTKDVSRRLNDNEWHSVYLEFNVQEVTVSVDGDTATAWRASEWAHSFSFSTQPPLVIGNSLNGSQGFLGCMRSLRVNGRPVDVTKAVSETGTSHGVQTGCQGKCDHVSNPCLNGGQCQDYYSTYMCDCSPTPFTGCYCGLELGVQIRSDGGIMVRLDKRLSESERHFRELSFGFKTTRHLGVLIHVTNAHPGFPDFLSVELRDEGVVVFLDVGHGESQLMSSAGAVDDGKIHYVTLTYNSTQEEMLVKVDDVTDVFNLTKTPRGVDTALDTPKRLYIARVARTVPGAGFEGCIFRLLYNNHPVLQDVFLNPTPSYVFIVGRGKIRKSSCGLSENVPMEIRRLHALRTLPKGNSEHGDRQPPLISNFTARVSMDNVVHLEHTHVMAGFQEISCSATGVPSPMFTWLKDRGPLSCPHLVVPGGRLLMPEDDRLDGTYQCAAHNVNGRAVSDKVTFQSPSVTRLRAVRRHKLVIREGGFLRLECSEHVESVPTTTVSWLYNDKVVNTTRVFQSPTGALNVLPVLKTDDGSNFTCVKTNELLDVSMKVKVIRLTVISATESGTAPQTETKLVYMTPPPLTAFIGKTVQLECLLKGKDAAKLRWHRENATRDTSHRWRIENKRRQLVITNVTEEDEGWYLCSTERVTFARYFLDVTAPPIWKTGLKSSKVYRGSHANFSCLARSAAGEPKPHRPRWLRNGRRLLGDKRHLFSADFTRLTILNVSRDRDLLTVQCNVSNHRGYRFAEAFLDIVEPLTIVRHPEEVSVERGQSVSIHVSVTLDPSLNASFTWLKTDQHIRQLQTPNTDPRDVFSVTSSRDRSTLTVNTEHVAEDDVMSYTGYYVCLVADGIGERHAKGKVVITLPADPPRGDDPSMLWGLGIAIGLGTVFIGAVVGIICITRRRKAGRQDKVAEVPLKLQTSTSTLS